MSIILSSIKRSIRDKNSLLGTLMLILVLPSIFSMMYSSTDIEKESINLCIKEDTKSRYTMEYVDFLKEFDKENDNIELNIYLNEKELDSDIVIELDDKNKVINFKGNKSLSMGESIVAKISEEFFNTVAMQEIMSQSSSINNINNQIIKNTVYSVDKEEMNYTAYFALVSLEMVTLVGSIFAFKNTYYIKENIGRRVKMASMKVSKLLTLELIGSFIIIFLQSVAILVISSIIYGVNINTNNVVPIMGLLGILSILAVSLGILCSSISKQKSWGENILSMIVTIMTISSGTLMPQWDINSMSITNLNPFKNIHQSLFLLVENNSIQGFNFAIGISVLYSVIMMIVAVVVLNRKLVD